MIGQFNRTLKMGIANQIIDEEFLWPFAHIENLAIWKGGRENLDEQNRNFDFRNTFYLNFSTSKRVGRGDVELIFFYQKISVKPDPHQ